MSWDRLISRETQVKNKDIHERSEGMSKFFTLFPHLMKLVKTLIKTHQFSRIIQESNKPFFDLKCAHITQEWQLIVNAAITWGQSSTLLSDIWRKPGGKLCCFSSLDRAMYQFANAAKEKMVVLKSFLKHDSKIYWQ
jgi:hypothetical protein